MTTYGQPQKQYAAKLSQKIIRFNPDKILDIERLRKIEAMDNFTHRVKQWIDSLPADTMLDVNYFGE